MGETGTESSSLLDRGIQAFAQAYGLKVNSASSVLGVITFIVIAAFGWPLLLRFGLKVNAMSSAPFTASSVEVLALPRHVEMLARENRELRSLLDAVTTRLNANERLAAELQTALAENNAQSASTSASVRGRKKQE